MSIKVLPSLFVFLFLVFSCEKPENRVAPLPKTTNKVEPPTSRDNTDALLNYVQYQYFQYVWSGGCTNSGLARVRYFKDEPEKDSNVITAGASGFAIMSIIVGIERGFVSRSEGSPDLRR